jgi:NADPH:quinone reductase-like Zn-dependent oxidoreductase
MLQASILPLFVSQKLLGLSATVNQKDLLLLKELIEAGKVTSVIDRTYLVREAPEAMRYLEKGHARQQRHHRDMDDAGTVEAVRKNVKKLLTSLLKCWT